MLATQWPLSLTPDTFRLCWLAGTQSHPGREVLGRGPLKTPGRGRWKGVRLLWSLTPCLPSSSPSDTSWDPTLPRGEGPRVAFQGPTEVSAQEATPPMAKPGLELGLEPGPAVPTPPSPHTPQVTISSSP